ncbi:MAG: type I pullulanase [Saprospiraceae bacterium]
MWKLLLLILMPLVSIAQMSFDQYPVYSGDDLGLKYSAKKSVFKVWAPEASQVVLRLYKEGQGGVAIDSVSLTKSINGTWQAVITRDIKNSFYTFQVEQAGKWLLESPDIYAKAVGVNGIRGMVIDLADTNPMDWKKDKRPALKQPTDIVLYESHVRDLSMSKNSGIKEKGKYLGVVASGTRGPGGVATGMDHLKELGITHLHLLPTFDFNSVDESKPELNTYNWGYDPLNYNVPEGSYSSNPYDGKVRIKEFKQMVQTLHANGIRVILDVVYNHTSNKESYFNQFAPEYYYRLREDGSYSDASGCGNETASERAMMRKFMLESVAYWVKEYHVDGFRFDLMGVHDIVTMNEISDALHKIDPTIFIYGEGWTAGGTPLAEDLRAVKKNTSQLKRIAAFNDDIRDGLHGPYNKVEEKGFVSGKLGTAESVKFGIVAATHHPQIDYSAVNYSKASWAKEPFQCINYVSCHDDNTLFDRLKIGNPEATEADLIKMDRLSQTIVLTSQGVPFIHSGAELLRSKRGIANSYNQPDSINQIDWSRKGKYNKVFKYYQSLIKLRNAHPAFRMPNTKMIQDKLQFIPTDDPLLIMYQLKDNANGDSWKDILLLFNGDVKDKKIALPEGKWMLVADGIIIKESGIKPLANSVNLPATTGLILYRMEGK